VLFVASVGVLGVAASGVVRAENGLRVL